ncbi:MAG: CRISPR-associated endonuclease Cas2 [Lachnospiraceae bacterium]|jgi:CRISPR-associated protein Cas2|nr:CRISPR-associated endonuclease Cas2 [Lachnospiraceae bacterium]
MYLISYDITDNRIRGKIAKELSGYGQRVQYSVFECRITEQQYKELYQKLYQKLVILMQEEEEGNIRIYNICGKCEQKLSTVGIESREKALDKDELIII